MDDVILTVRCACGWQTMGTEDQVVTATKEHGMAVHNMGASRDEVLAMAVRSAPTAPQVERAAE